MGINSSKADNVLVDGEVDGGKAAASGNTVNSGTKKKTVYKLVNSQPVTACSESSDDGLAANVTGDVSDNFNNVMKKIPCIGA